MSKKISFKQKHVAGPPKGQIWVWHTIDMRTTEKWRLMPQTARRLLDRIEVEHMAHKGLENGRLGIAYSQFEEWGISRRSIPTAIDYAVDAGFLEVTKRGLRLKETTNEYRLTYFATRERTPKGAYEYSAPTNEWKRRAGKSFFSRAESDTPLGQKVTLTEAFEPPQMAENLKSDLGQKVTLSTISSGCSHPPALPRPPRALPVPPGAVRQRRSPLFQGAEKLGAPADSTSAIDAEGASATLPITAGGRR